MRIISISILLIFVLTRGFSQGQIIQKENITPNNVISIGGISIFNDSLYLLLPSNIRYNKKDVEASEANTISQKYQVWDIYYYNLDSGLLVNKSSRWNTANASPNGFTILDDSTVIYVNNKLKLESNNPEIRPLFSHLNQGKTGFADPFFDKMKHRIYFSSNLEGGKGKMDLWFIEYEKNKLLFVRTAGNMNTSLNEISPSVVDDSVFVFSSEGILNQYDICFYNLKTGNLIHREETPSENEYFTLAPKKGIVYFMVPKGKMNTLWKGFWSVEKKEDIENISSLEVKEIPKTAIETGMELPREDTNEDLEIKMKNYFGPAKYQLTPFMQDSLSRLAKLLKNNPDMNIVICGHASPDGPDNLNMMLSYYRANEAYKCLIANQVDEKRIFRIYAGENLLSDAYNARMFSIFTTTESDLPRIDVVYKLGEKEKKEEILNRFGSNTDEMEYVKYATKKQLPVGGANIILIPVKDIHIVKKGETLYSMAIQYGIKLQALIEANHITPESFKIGDIVLIPGQ
jgi:outer membrane protein OmpA-like peptidoglycan-associated protein/LysM repeat protein